MELLEWTSNYIDHMNVFKKNLLGKKASGSRIRCQYKDKGNITYIVCEDMDENLIKEINDRTMVVCLNKKKNVDFLIKHWKDFIRYPHLKLIFSNPAQNLQWSLIPNLHHKVSDPETLELGLHSMSESVPLST